MHTRLLLGFAASLLCLAQLAAAQHEAPSGQPSSLGRLFGAAPTRPTVPRPEIERLAERLRELRRDGDAGAVRVALERAAQALASARRARAAGARQSAARALQIARAALVLAERRIAAGRAEAERAAAEHRAREAEQAREAARRALERTRTRLAARSDEARSP